MATTLYKPTKDNKYNISIASIIEIYYRLINFGYTIKNDEIKQIFENINKRLPKINYKYIYPLNDLERYIINFNMLVFPYDSTFNYFELKINNLYDDVEIIINDEKMNDNKINALK